MPREKLKTIGILGGLGPPSTEIYYRELNRKALKKYGRYPEIIVNSLSFQTVFELHESPDQSAYIDYLFSALDRLSEAGAEIIAIASVTPHDMFEPLAAHCPVPLLSIVDASLVYARKMAWRKLLLLGTGFTMDGGFFQKGFAAKSIELVLPDENDRKWLHETIIKEMSQGIITDTTRIRLDDLIREAKGDGADAVLLGCTELGSVWANHSAPLPSLDSASAHIDFLLNAAKLSNNSDLIHEGSFVEK